MLTMRNNDVTRVRADIESALFHSAVPPRIAIRLLHVLAASAAVNFKYMDSEQVHTLHKVFRIMHEYVSKDTLDALLCFVMKADVVDDQLVIKLSGDVDSDGGGGGGAQPVSWPLYCINDINLVTVVDSIKMLME